MYDVVITKNTVKRIMGNNYSEEYRKRISIDKILASPRIGFFRLCGRELQLKYRAANRTSSNPNREALLKEIIDVYDSTLDNKQPPMDEKEKKFKKKLIRQYSRKKWAIKRKNDCTRN